MEFFNSSGRSSSSQPNPINLAFPPFDGTTDFGILESPIFKLKSSKYRGVQKIKDKEIYVAHVYDNGYSPKEGRTRRFDKEENAARAHDLVSLKFWGTSIQTNFPITDYVKAVEAMANMNDQDVVAAVRRSSNSFSRGKSKYRGVVRHANSGKWQARKGPGRDSFLGTFETEEEAAIAFDIASIKLKGIKAITNFDIKSYNVRAILEGKTEPGNIQAEKVVNHAETFVVSTIQEKPESSVSNMGIGSRKKKRSLTFHGFLGKQAETGFSGNINSLRGNPVIAPAGSEFQHGNKIPFSPETVSIGSSRELRTSWDLGFKHSNSSAFQSYEQAKPRESLVLQEANNQSPAFKILGFDVYLPYKTNLFEEKDLQCLPGGFQHASSSCFKPFKKL
ncbi:AP2/ERF transcription factor [Parasponia andersonii]|uniref:AP2/ERF transcription factor n=1 Tax=Parasponia andersonii TaxID=3476 RepID=A0A2P5CAT9_PARAD|nr:AP2/ERF transcription factor [Parasponia andersonii]